MRPPVAVDSAGAAAEPVGGGEKPDGDGLPFGSQPVMHLRLTGNYKATWSHAQDIMQRPAMNASSAVSSPSIRCSEWTSWT